MASAVRFDQVVKVYRDGLTRKAKTALQGLDLEVREGEVFGFLGPNGAGKSTAIKILLNLLYPTSGKVHLLGREVHDPHVRNQVGYLPELPYLYDHLTVSELLWFGARVAGIPRRRINDKSKELLKLLELEEACRRPLRAFSKGMLQRAGLALALIHDPHVVILDEPMTGLDPLGRKLVADVIRQLRRDGKTVFFSSHILSDAADLCDRVGILVDGRLTRVLDIGTLNLAPPRGWRVVVEVISGPFSEFIRGEGGTITPHDGSHEIRWTQQDVYPLLERIRKEDGRLIFLEPLRESLEEIFLSEIGRSRERAL